MSETPRSIRPEVQQPAAVRTKRNVLFNWAGFGVASIVNLLLSPFIIHHLGNTVYGIWVLMMSLTGYLSLLDMGVRIAVTRYVAKFHTESDVSRASRTVSSALAIFAVAGVVAISISLALVSFGLGWFHIPGAYLTAARIVLVLSGINVAVTLVSGVFGGVLVGLQRFDLSKAIELLGTAVRALGIVAVILAGQGLIGLACIHLLSSVLMLLANAWFSRRAYPQLRIGIANCDRQHLALIFSFSLYSFLLNLAVYVSFYTDSVVIGTFLPVSQIAFFMIAGNLIQYSREFVNGIGYVLLPVASALEARRDLAEMRRVVLTGSRFATMVFLPIGVSFLLRGKSFIGLWMGPSYAELSGQVLSVLTLALLFSARNQVSAEIMRGIGKHKAMVPVYVGEALCNLAASVALVRPMGIVGVAWGTTLPSLAVSLLFWPWYLHRTLGISVREYVVSGWVRPALAVIPFALTTYAVEVLWATPNLILFFLQVAVTLPVAAVGFWYLSLTSLERHAYSVRFLPPVLRAFRLLRTVHHP